MIGGQVCGSQKPPPSCCAPAARAAGHAYDKALVAAGGPPAVCWISRRCAGAPAIERSSSWGPVRCCGPRPRPRAHRCARVGGWRAAASASTRWLTASGLCRRLRHPRGARQRRAAGDASGHRALVADAVDGTAAAIAAVPLEGHPEAGPTRDVSGAPSRVPSCTVRRRRMSIPVLRDWLERAARRGARARHRRRGTVRGAGTAEV